MTDYIKREDAKKWLTNLREDCGRYQDLWPYAEALDQIIELLDTDVAPVRHGHWDFYDGKWYCSVCGYCMEWCLSKPIEDWCGSCGARMDGEDDEID